MYRHISVTLLETIVFSNIMQVITSNDDRTLHLVLDHLATKNSTTDGHIASEWTLFVDVISVDGLIENTIRLDNQIE